MIEVDPEIGMCPPKSKDWSKQKLRHEWYKLFATQWRRLLSIHGEDSYQRIAVAYGADKSTISKWVHLGMPGERKVKAVRKREMPLPKPEQPKQFTPTQDQLLEEYFRRVQLAPPEPISEEQFRKRKNYQSILRRAVNAPKSMAIVEGDDDDA